MFWQTFVPPQFLLSFGTIHVSWYGVCISLALICGASFLFWNIKHSLLKHTFFESKSFELLLICIIVSGIIGARLLFVIYHTAYFQEHVWEIFAVWNGGWVWHGGFIGGILGAVFFWLVKRFPLALTADFLAPSLVLAQGIGRWGNYFNQENYGLPTDKWFGIFIEPARRIPQFQEASLFHPTFFYESILSFLIFIILFRYVKQNHASQTLIVKPGTLFFIYLSLYSTVRFFLEILRVDSVPLIAGLRAPAWLSILFLLISIMYFLTRTSKKRLIIPIVFFVMLFVSLNPVRAETIGVKGRTSFISQAPTTKWGNPIFQNACEEASLLMAYQWYHEAKSYTKKQAEKKIITTARAMKKKYGSYYDSSAYDTAEFAKEYFKLKNIFVRFDIRAQDIINELEKGNLVIVPANGIKLKNPNFKQPGPLQHMLVVKGYDFDTHEFITNDPGTRRGENYRYGEKRLINAIRDYPTGEHKPITASRKAMIVVLKKS